MPATTKNLFNVPAARAFGAEIEFIMATGATEGVYSAALRRAGVDAYCAGYTHETTTRWKLVTDGSIGSNGRELVSPILAGEFGFAQLRAAGEALAENGAGVSRNCGYHVHVDARDLDLFAIKRVVIMFLKFERAFDALMPASRRGSTNVYCRSNIGTLARETGGVKEAIAKIKSATTMDELRRALNADRYHKLNLESLGRHGTIEFRHHSGTVDAEKLANWAELCVRFVEIAAKAQHIAYCDESRIENLLSMFPVPMRKFYRARAAALNGGAAE